MERLTNPTGVIARALRENDRTCVFAPRVPTRLYVASGGLSVLLANPEQCRKTLRAHGGDGELIELGDIAPMTSEQHAVPSVARWFAGHPGT
ncbi:hypothetical protein ACFWM7_17445 [Streptomyces sp. NPDC058375]|uniref:hypothetical protein n=1 Tax=Streptomyces sp. NPDC058375 TaxID=3346467 RepID=UPI0036667286